ncbi:MAG: LysR family transcriptional regulator [Burkholderiaceae bacterium]|nr:LysR family transcriptional regulator [Rhodoferax sp.]MCB2005005.1 LysR family transcriptional regulator [Rhodoferax sp.]MCB2027992.1 LysR family transcriptional regulator [Rhodoferax sp.]MCB2040739.1 LysR family transcriptional regulator [Rhodoferax sp.]MCP5260989.1 LysR family transcriptional regulator [Rhodoferax sp.]
MPQTSDLNFRTLDLNLLRVFDAVMEERSLTRAARSLSLTQPAVSNALSRLRLALGDELVRRSGQGVAPTPRALGLWPAVRDALRQLQQSLAPDGFVPADADNEFVLAMADATAAELVPKLVALIETEAPKASLRVVPLATRDPRKLLDEEAIDLAIGHFPAVLSDLGARAQVGKAVSYLHQRVYATEYVCVMRAGHPLASGPLTLNRFCAARHMLVSFGGRPFGFIDEALQSRGRTRRIVLTVNQFFTAARVAAQCDLLTVLPRHFLELADEPQRLVARALPLEVPAVHVDALWHNRQDTSSAHRWLRDAVMRAVPARILAMAP